MPGWDVAASGTWPVWRTYCPRPWSPSLDVSDRMSDRSFIPAAMRGRCSQIWIPRTAVSMALNGPFVSWPGFGSNVSMWLGPPSMKRTITALAFARAAASWAIRAGESDAAAVAPSPIRRNERRSSSHISVPRHEFRGIQQGPEDVFVDPGSVPGLADPRQERLALARLRRPRQGQQEELLDPLRGILLALQQPGEAEFRRVRGSARDQLPVQEVERLRDRGIRHRHGRLVGGHRRLELAEERLAERVAAGRLAALRVGLRLVVSRGPHHAVEELFRQQGRDRRLG